MIAKFVRLAKKYYRAGRFGKFARRIARRGLKNIKQAAFPQPPNLGPLYPHQIPFAKLDQARLDRLDRQLNRIRDHIELYDALVKKGAKLEKTDLAKRKSLLMNAYLLSKERQDAEAHATTNALKEHNAKLVKAVSLGVVPPDLARPIIARRLREIQQQHPGSVGHVLEYREPTPSQIALFRAARAIPFVQNWIMRRRARNLIV